MNDTNRAVNRIVLLVVGLVLIVVGVTITAAATWPVAGELWRTGAASTVDAMITADQQTRISAATTLSWFVLGVLAVLVLIVVLAVVVIARLGGGRSDAVIRVESGEGAQGPITIRNGFASDAIAHSLARRDEILSCRVSARRVRGTEVLHVSVTPRQNTSPADVAAIATQLVDNLAVLTGRASPAFVSIHSGMRARLAADRSRVD